MNLKTKPFMNHFFVSSRIIILIFIIEVFGSCQDKEQEYLLQESVKRLGQQNECIKQENQKLHIKFHALMDDEFPYRNIIYLEKTANNFRDSTRALLEEIKIEKNSISVPDKEMLFAYYDAFQHSYQHFQSCIKDSFEYTFSHSFNINGFMKLDKKAFIQKYFGLSNPTYFRTQLLLLESDILLNEQVFIDDIIINLSPSCNYGEFKETAIAFPNKCIYKKGDKLQITTIVAKYAESFKGQAVLEGQTINSKNGLFEYSRIIAEPPGIYNIPVKVKWLNNRNNQDSISAEVAYKVE